MLALAIAGCSDPADAKVGDCIDQTGENDVSVVECADAKAQFKVVGVVKDASYASASISACSKFKTATSSYWQGTEITEPGTVLCMEPIKK